MSMRVLILGGVGMLGHKVYQLYRRRFDAWTTNLSGYEEFARYDLFDPQRFVGGVDVANFDSVVRVLADVKPDVVFNCVGIIKQLKASKDPDYQPGHKFAVSSPAGESMPGNRNTNDPHGHRLCFFRPKRRVY